MAKLETQGFGGLFKPAWQSESAAKRLDAVAGLDGNNPKDQEILHQLAQDPDEAVSLAAIAAVSDLNLVARLAEGLPGEAQQGAARLRFRQLIADGRMADVQWGLAWLNAMPGRAADFAISASFEGVREAALTQLEATQWLAVLGDAQYTDTRQWIVERLGSLEEMLSARKLIRGRDKTAERLLKERIDAIRRDEHARDEMTAQAEALIEKAHYFSTHLDVPDFSKRVAALRQAWARLEGEVDAALRERYAQASQAMVESHEHLQHIAEVERARAARLEEMQASIDAIRRQSLAAILGSGDTIRSTADAHAAAWRALAAPQATDDAGIVRYEAMQVALRAAAEFADLAAPSASPDRALRQLSWPRGFGEFQPALELKQTIEAEVRAEKEREASHQKNLDRVHKQISTIARTAKAGQLARAHGLCKSVERELEKFQGSEQAHLLERLNAAREALEKMDDWKNFATEPKYQQLCAAMEKLVGSPRHPDALSGDIKKLQQQWKSLGHSEVSEQYWERFKAAADQAFAPCAVFFEQRRETRRENLEKRESCVARMRALAEDTDGAESPDYAAIQRQFRDIGRDFQAIKDVEQAAGRKQWKRFNAYRDAVRAHLEPELDRNHESQQQLIGLMSSLADAPPAPENLDRMKGLQARWKQIGITRPSEGNKAWQAFKKQGDRAFENLQSLRKQEKQARDDVLEQYRSMIRSIRQLARDAGDIPQLDSRFEELQQAYRDLPELHSELPDKLRKGIDRDYQKACSEIDDARSRFLARRQQSQLEALRQKAALCLELETPQLSDAERATITARWEQIELSDPELARRIEKRRAAATESRDLEAIAQERRLFCIQAEIALGQPSPDADRQLRMQYQLEQMNKHGLGQAKDLKARATAQQWEIDWLCMPGVDAERQAELDARFQRCIGQSRKPQKA